MSTDIDLKLDIDFALERLVSALLLLGLEILEIVVKRD